MDESFYETRNNYVDLIAFEEIMTLCDILYNPYKSRFFNNISFYASNDDSKNALIYTIRRDCNNDIAETGSKYVLSCSDGRELSLEYASLHDNYYLNIIYKLNDTEKLLFQFRVARYYKEDNGYKSNRFKKENIDFLKYGKLKFKKSLLPYCRVVNRYGKVKESESMIKVHRMIIDNLIKKSFTRDELKLIVMNLDKIYHDEFSKRIYCALVGDGISR